MTRVIEGINKQILAGFAPLLEYPSLLTISNAISCKESCSSVSTEAARHLSHFVDWLSVTELYDAEELYTRTFYVAPLCIPYVSVHLFGEENFRRGELMAQLKSAFLREGFDPGSELPDHIATLLRFCAFIDEEELEELLHYCIVPSVREMSKQFEAARNAYSHIFKALEILFAGG
ncbi:MAG: molecular chaperone TorD family protein [Acidobacteriota bacterium]|nr:molecular chaperone TorD family protein [Blastocatellia bacterium]MDW8413775.1 molecular chaperone TorD family protein [Acidobacteriota bacterium]